MVGLSICLPSGFLPAKHSETIWANELGQIEDRIRSQLWIGFLWPSSIEEERKMSPETASEPQSSNRHMYCWFDITENLKASKLILSLHHFLKFI